MTTYIARRFINLVPTFLLATFLAWIIIELAPGDFASQFAFDTVDTTRAERIREQLGLDRPWYERYGIWLRNVVTRFDFGTSMTTRGDVTNIIVPRMWNSLRLVLISTLLIYLIAIPIGVYSAINKYSLGDRLLTVFSLFGLAIPNFFMALLALAFLTQWRLEFGWFLLPTGGMSSEGAARMGEVERLWDAIRHLIAPTLVVTLSGLAGLTRITRGQMLEVMGQDYVRTAKAKGLSSRSVTYKHALRNAVVPVVATIGSVLPGLISGAGFVEIVLRWPGLTPLLIRSIFAQDVYVIMAILTIGTILLMVGNLISDLLLAVIDPRIRY